MAFTNTGFLYYLLIIFTDLFYCNNRLVIIFSVYFKPQWVVQCLLLPQALKRYLKIYCITFSLKKIYVIYFLLSVCCQH